MKRTAILLTFFLAPLCVSGAADKNDGPAWVDPATAAKENPDFLVQGEYTKAGVGIQVVALGKGQFQTSHYKGGLPGAGWDGSEIDSITGSTDEIKVVLKGAKRVERKSPTLGQKPPTCAIVLFDGTSADAWSKGKISDGLLESGAETKQTFGDFQLHLEFRLPFKPESPAGGQGRGNSGIYTHNRYETQVLDSFGLNLDRKDWEKRGRSLKSDPKQWCGCLYKFKLADTNMCLPPLTWQTYDITFTAAKFDGDKKTTNARITVLHNGVKIHDDVELPKGTGAGGGRKEIPKGPIVIQGHGNPVRYRNVWIVERENKAKT